VIERRPHSLVHHLFEHQASETPDKLAVSCGDRTLTYAELDLAAETLASSLRARGACAEKLIGLYVDRSVSMVVALLAILKSGAAYVPLDPSFPADRIDFMIQDAALNLIVTEPQLAPRLAKHPVQCVYVDGAAEQPAPAGDAVATTPDNLAYVIYTSGSTGRPKGVQVLHRGVVNFLQSMRRTPGCTPNDVMIAVTTLSFDIAVLEILLPLVTGASVVLATRTTAVDGDALAQLIADAGATIMQATPATWRLLVESGWQGQDGLRILCGGEALPRLLAGDLLTRGTELWNLYGPTETTIWSTLQRVTSADVITIGQPIAETVVRVLDESRQDVEDGTPGELFIGGTGLARGYLNRPELTAERFVPDPRDASARLYRTGDVVRRLPSGDLEFLGRADHQVKISGYRIELGEIEAVLEEHPRVAQAIVCATNDSDGSGRRLIGYLRLHGPVDHLIGTMRKHLARKLPRYMVPSAFVQVESFPMTPNRKVDRGALLAINTGQVFDEGDHVEPRTELETALCSIWTEVLGIESIGVTDNFFDLGASSINGARLLSAMETEFGRRLPLGALFQAPTIEAFAKMVEEAPAVPTHRWTSLVPVQPLGSKPPIFCVHGGAGTVYVYHALARRLGTDQPFYAFQSQGLYGDQPPHHKVEEMAAHYISEMRTVQPTGPYALGGYCFGGIVAYEMAQQLAKIGERVNVLTLFNAPNYLYYQAQGGDQRVIRPVSAGEPLPPASARSASLRLKRLYWYLAKTKPSDISILIRRMRWRTARARGQALPAHVRDYFFWLNNQKAERDYVAKPYVGDMVLFRAEVLERVPTLGWGPLVKAGVQVHPVAANNRSREIMQEPWVRDVATALAGHLSIQSTPVATRAFAAV